MGGMTILQRAAMAGRDAHVTLLLDHGWVLLGNNDYDDDDNENDAKNVFQGESKPLYKRAALAPGTPGRSTRSPSSTGRPCYAYREGGWGILTKNS